jgi:hypothetical protein
MHALRLGPRAGPHVRSDEELISTFRLRTDVELLLPARGAPYAIPLESIADVAPPAASTRAVVPPAILGSQSGEAARSP